MQSAGELDNTVLCWHVQVLLMHQVPVYAKEPKQVSAYFNCILG